MLFNCRIVHLYEQFVWICMSHCSLYLLTYCSYCHTTCNIVYIIILFDILFILTCCSYWHVVRRIYCSYCHTVCRIVNIVVNKNNQKWTKNILIWWQKCRYGKYDMVSKYFSRTILGLRIITPLVQLFPPVRQKFLCVFRSLQLFYHLFGYFPCRGTNKIMKLFLKILCRPSLFNVINVYKLSGTHL